MPTLRMKVTPKFPAQVLGGDGITIAQSGGVYTISVDSGFFPALDADLVGIAALNPTADKSIYWTAADSPALYTLTSLGRSLVGGATTGAMQTTLGISAFAQTILDDADASASRTTLGLGTSAVVDTGTSGTKVALLDGANTWSANQTVSGTGTKTLDVTSTTTGSLNDAQLNLKRGDAANGYASAHLRTGATQNWSFGLRAGDSDFHVYDEVALAERFTIKATGSVVLGSAAVATNATDGFLYVVTCAGAPSGTPTAVTGRVPLIYDTTNNRLYAYNGAWKLVALA